jgi:hypothetical protein
MIEELRFQQPYVAGRGTALSTPMSETSSSRKEKRTTMSEVLLSRDSL